jgi:hypothetical protein
MDQPPPPAGQQINMVPGAIAACALPMSMGVLGLYFSFQPAEQYQLILTLPIVLCFIFGTPLTAWLACRYLSKIEDAGHLSRWITSVFSGAKYASLVHLFSATLYTLGVAVWLMGISGVGAVHIKDAGEIVTASIMINIPLWICVTIPLSLICSTLFWVCTTFLEDRNVF